jgi:hypothetical protein
VLEVVFLLLHASRVLKTKKHCEKYSNSEDGVNRKLRFSNFKYKGNGMSILDMPPGINPGFRFLWLIAQHEIVFAAA